MSTQLPGIGARRTALIWAAVLTAVLLALIVGLSLFQASGTGGSSTIDEDPEYWCGPIWCD